MGESQPRTESETISTAPAGFEDDGVGRLLGPAVPVETLEVAVAFEEVRAQLFASQADAVAVDRYVLRDRIGRGGCGVVYRGFDPKLRRDVAIKLISIDGGGDGDSDMDRARRHLLREARALATVSHPNIVSVYGVGTYTADDRLPAPRGRGQGVFIVMELIDGRTLAQWLGERPRSTREVLRYFIDAANALAAAHDAGILHGDFKLANAMIGADDRVRVLDFGLARARADTGPSGPSTRQRGRDPHPSSLELSIVDGVMGTPVYMSPEQHRGEPLGAACDQYALCVALHAALYGAYPFQGTSLDALYDQKLNERIRVEQRRPRLPRALQRLLVRGLRANPTERFASMHVLVDELRRIARTRDRRRWFSVTAWGGAGVVTLMGAGLLGEVGSKPCSAAASHLEGVWDAARRSDVEAAMLGVEGSYAPLAWERSAEHLDAFVQQWTNLYVETCEATTVRGEAPAAVMDLKMACLQGARDRLDAVTRVLADADEDVVLNADRVLGELPSLTRCSDTDLLEADVEPPPPREATDVKETRALLAEARSELVAGRFSVAQAHLRTAKERLRTVEYEPVRAEALLEEGLILEARGQFRESADALREALRSATGCGHRQVLLEAATGLILVLGQRLGHLDDGLEYVEGALELAKNDVARTAEIHDNAAFVYRQGGDYEAAEREARAAIALRIEAFGADTVPVAKSRMNLASVLAMQGRRAEAEVEFRATLSIQEAILGPTHPAVGSAWNNLGAILQLQREYRGAERAFRRALEVQLETLGPEHPSVPQTKTNLATSLSSLGRYEQAQTELEDALETMILLQGSAHPSVAVIRHQLAVTLERRDELARAEEQYRLVLAHYEEALGAEHPDVATMRSNLANCLLQQGKLMEAEAAYRRALQVSERAFEEEHPDTARVQTGLATVLEEQGRYSEALELAELSWRTRQRTDAPDAEQAEAAFLVARVRLEVEPTKVTRAMSLGEDARRTFERAGDDARARDVQTWIERHR